MNLKMSFNVPSDFELDCYLDFVKCNFLLVPFDVWNEGLFVRLRRDLLIYVPFLEPTISFNMMYLI